MVGDEVWSEIFSGNIKKVMTERNNQQNQQKDNQLPEDVLNAEQDPNSLKDPLQVQLDKSKGNDEANAEQQRKEAMTERD